MVNVGSGVADLILLPIEQYRKDGRVARGVQRGTNSFVRSTAMEMMKLGARLATGTQVILEKAEGVLGGKFGENVVGEVEVEGVREMNSEDEADPQTREVVSRYANQPEDVREGVQAAYQSLSRNINSAAQTILAVPMEVYERSGEDVSDLHNKRIHVAADLVTLGPAQSCCSCCSHCSSETNDRRIRGGEQDLAGYEEQPGPRREEGISRQVQVTSKNISIINHHAHLCIICVVSPVDLYVCIGTVSRTHVMFGHHQKFEQLLLLLY